MIHKWVESFNNKITYVCDEKLVEFIFEQIEIDDPDKEITSKNFERLFSIEKKEYEYVPECL